MSEPVFTPVARANDIPAESARLILQNGRAILICYSEGKFFAVENLCSHAHESLECGRIKRGWIACPAHGARFDLATGDPLGPPATEAIATFPLRVVEGMVEIAI